MAKLTPEERQKKNKKFVSALGWFFLGFFLYSAVSSVFQLVIFSHTPPMDYIKGYFDGPDSQMMMEFMPPFLTGLLSDYFLELTWISLITSALLVYPGYAMVKRQPWSRMFWAVFMLATIAVGIVPFFFTQHLMPQIPGGGSPELAAVFERTIYFALAAFALFITGFHGWIAYRLMSKEIKEEFCGDAGSVESA